MAAAAPAAIVLLKAVCELGVAVHAALHRVIAEVDRLVGALILQQLRLGQRIAKLVAPAEFAEFVVVLVLS